MFQESKPADIQHATVATRSEHRGKRVIWLVGHNQQLFDHASIPMAFMSSRCIEPPLVFHLLPGRSAQLPKEIVELLRSRRDVTGLDDISVFVAE